MKPTDMSPPEGVDARVFEKVVQHCQEAYRADEPFRAQLGGHELIVHPGVFNPAIGHTPPAIIESLIVPAGGDVLDMGCGTGVFGILALLRGARSALLADKSPAAIVNARANVELHALEDRCEVVSSDLYDEIDREIHKRRFAVIYSNLPFLWAERPISERFGPFSPDTVPESYAYYDGAYLTIERFFLAAPDYLTPDGCIQCTWSTYANHERLASILDRAGLVKQQIHSVPDLESGDEYLVYRIERRT